MKFLEQQYVIYTILFSAFLPQAAFSWSWPSHVIIYMIAREDIGGNLRTKVDEMMHVMPESENNYANPYEYAIWADDIKLRDNFRLLDGMHFYDQPFCDGIERKDIKLLIDPTFNVVRSVIDGITALKHKGNFPHNFDGKMEKSYMLRMLVHMVGDMHQPLHVTTRCTQARKTCDEGGNLFKIAGTPGDLHALWDHAVNAVPALGRPLNAAAITKYMTDFVHPIMKQFTRASLQKELKIKDPWEWAKEGFEVAKNVAYKGIKEGERPSEAYKKTGWEAAKKMIALAGYRLADIIKEDLYGDEEVQEIIE